MVFRLAHSEYSNRHTFEASVQRRSWLRRLVLVTTLMMLAFFFELGCIAGSWRGSASVAWLRILGGLRFRDGSNPKTLQGSS